MSGCSGRMLAALILINILTDITKCGTLCQHAFSLPRARGSCLCPSPTAPAFQAGTFVHLPPAAYSRLICQFLMILKHFTPVHCVWNTPPTTFVSISQIATQLSRLSSNVMSSESQANRYHLCDVGETTNLSVL